MSQHLRLPLTVGPDGTFRTVVEDSLDEITQNVLVILRTRTGERLATPDLGVPDPTFAGFDADEALDHVRTYEDRADLDVVRQALTGAGVQTTVISVGGRIDPGRLLPDPTVAPSVPVTPTVPSTSLHPGPNTYPGGV